MSISSIRYNSSQTQLKDYSLIKVTGEDREAFFQGQVTNDLSLLSPNEGQLTSRLNRVGKLQSFFYIAKLPTSLLILCSSELTNVIKSDFEKFIIMDDVELEIINTDLWLQFNYFLEESIETNEYFDFIHYGINARLVFKNDPTIPITNQDELLKIRILNGWPKWQTDIDSSNFINDNYLNEIAISYKKGCFLGQETAAKIENNRGAAYYPSLLKLNEFIDLKQYLSSDFFIETTEGLQKAGKILYQVENIIQVLLFRDYRVVARELNLVIGEIKINAAVMKLPFYKSSRTEIALELYHKGVEEFQRNNQEVSKDYLKKALCFDTGLADAYESLGVILGREEKFNEAIEWMDKLLIVNPKSVMAHTNKSLYLMRLGLITEAEAEKSLATVKSFAYFGQEAKEKKQLIQEEENKKNEILRREKMFLQVLEIDEEDTIALYGMAEVFFHRKEFLKVIENLKKVIIIDSKYSTAYLLLGKAHESAEEIDNAISVYQSGIVVASKRGDLMPANEMQSRLNQLVVSSRPS